MVILMERNSCFTAGTCSGARLNRAWSGLFCRWRCSLPGPRRGPRRPSSSTGDIRPILVENCFACHGPDNAARKAGLRFDMKDGLFERTPKHEPAVVPGSLEKSELGAHHRH